MEITRCGNFSQKINSLIYFKDERAKDSFSF